MAQILGIVQTSSGSSELLRSLCEQYLPGIEVRQFIGEGLLNPAISVQLIFTFVESWNNYFLPALLLDKAEMKTVPIMIAQLRAADYSKFDLGKVYMFILLAILPVLLVYIFLSRYIVKGVTAGSVKG